MTTSQRALSVNRTITKDCSRFKKDDLCDDGLCYYKDMITVADEALNIIDTKSQEGIAQISEVNAAYESGIAGINKEITITKDGCHSNKVVACAIKRNLLESVQRNEEKLDRALIFDITKEIYDDVDNYEIVLFSLCAFTLMDVNENYIPLPIHIDYTVSNFSNARYNLDKVLAKLKNDERILNRDNIHISHIPYYNATRNSAETIEFDILLSDKEYNLLQKEYLNTESYRTRAEILFTQFLDIQDCELTIEELIERQII